MAHAIICGDNGCSHEVDFGTAEISISLHAGSETAELASKSMIHIARPTSGAWPK